MLNESTIEKLNEMRLKSMAEAFREQINNPALYTLSFEERFGIIVDKQWSSKRDNLLSRLNKKATLKFSQASIEDIEYHPDRKLNKNQIL